MKILVVAAHPDDEVLGCGGTMARLSREGHEIFIAILGEGITARYADRTAADPVLLQELHDLARRAGARLGAKDVFLYHLPDNRFDTVPLLDIIKIVERLIVQHQPEVVYTHHQGDLNIDHAILARAVLTAARPLPGQPIKELYAFEIPSSTEWAFNQLGPIFQPNVFVNISQTLDIKLSAMDLYEKEARPFPHPRSRQALISLAQRWGSAAGLPAAEAFSLIRRIDQ
ncbi:MAG: PIG-L family deacetylase [Deltaproteobacteria bacterium]|nr:PIG-L family deacetylase [Deltaproteobacteria bacterium]